MTKTKAGTHMSVIKTLDNTYTQESTYLDKFLYYVFSPDMIDPLDKDCYMAFEQYLTETSGNMRLASRFSSIPDSYNGECGPHWIGLDFLPVYSPGCRLHDYGYEMGGSELDRFVDDAIFMFNLRVIRVARSFDFTSKMIYTTCRLVGGAHFNYTSIDTFEEVKQNLPKKQRRK